MGLMLSFYAFRHMTLSDASTIIFSTPVFVVIFAKIFLGEPCGVLNIVMIFFTLMGVVLITRPPILFSEINATWSTPRKVDFLFQNSSTVNLVDFTPNQRDLAQDEDAKFDVWGPVAAISSTLFGAVNTHRQLKEMHSRN